MTGGRDPGRGRGPVPCAAPSDTGRPRDRASSGSERGIALLLVLWLLVLLSIMALSFSGTARTQARIARNLHDNAQARWLADAGVRLAIRHLWLAGKEQGVTTDGSVRNCRLRESTLATAVQDVSGLVDLNAASADTLERLFREAGADGDTAYRLAQAVADYRDPDDTARPNGAEEEDYRAAGLTHGPKDGPFQAVEELEQVAGMMPQLLDRIRPAVTVLSRRPIPDLRIAPPLVRAALTEEASDDRQSGFYSAGRRQGIFAVTVTARTVSGALFSRHAVVTVNGPPSYSYRVMHWRQARTPANPPAPDLQDLPPC